MNYALVYVASVAAIVCSDGYSSAVAVVSLSIYVILSFFVLKELFIQNFPNGEIVGPFSIGCIMQNNMEFAKASFGAEGTQFEHNVPTCRL